MWACGGRGRSIRRSPPSSHSTAPGRSCVGLFAEPELTPAPGWRHLIDAGAKRPWSGNNGSSARKDEADRPERPDDSAHARRRFGDHVNTDVHHSCALSRSHEHPGTPDAQSPKQLILDSPVGTQCLSKMYSYHRAGDGVLLLDTKLAPHSSTPTPPSPVRNLQWGREIPHAL